MRGAIASLLLVLVACDGETNAPPPGATSAASGGGAATTSASGGGGGMASTTTSTTGAGGGGGSTPMASVVNVDLVPEGVTGVQTVNFAVPLSPGQLDDADRVRVLAGGSELASYRLGLAPRADGSFRSVQLQVEVDVDSVDALEVRVGEAAMGGDRTAVSVESTLVAPDGEQGPRVWAVLPASWLSASGVAGPLLPEADTTGDATAWASLCNVDTWGTSAFLGASPGTTAGVWLYDRGTVMHRAYARRGDLTSLRAAYVETSMYRNDLTGSGAATRNGVPGSDADVKYSYTQNMALHYLLTGDERHRESAEDMAEGVASLWTSPGYAGGADFWTERHAGFAILAYVWAAQVSDDAAAALLAEADTAVQATLDVQSTYPAGYTDSEARCFAHGADAHGETFGYFGCSPWMSAILADALYGYIRVGGTHANAVRDSLIQLGTMLAREGRHTDGNPYYWMGVGTTSDEIDGFVEHIGESAYVIAMAAHLTSDATRKAELTTAAQELVTKFANDGVAGQIRSFNWQCRSAVAAPWFLEQL